MSGKIIQLKTQPLAKFNLMTEIDSVIEKKFMQYTICIIIKVNLIIKTNKYLKIY